MLVESGETIAQAVPPRHDTAKRYSWNLAEHVGKQAHFEIIDGQDLKAYAWLAVARFEPALISMPKAHKVKENDALLSRAIRWADDFGINDFDAKIAAIAADSANGAELRSQALEVIGADNLELVERALVDGQETLALRVTAAKLLLKHSPDKALAPLQDIFTVAGRADQEGFATVLSGSKAGAELLLALIENGKASAQLLQMGNLPARLRGSGLPDVDARIEAPH